MAKKEPYKDWIVRYYASHNDIPPGHTDGELTELIRCKDCKYSVDEYDDGECYCDYDKCLRYVKDWNHYCSLAERREK